MEGEFTMLEHQATGVIYFIVGALGLVANILILMNFLRGKPLEAGRSSLHVHIAVGNLMIVSGCLFSGSSAFSGKWLYGELGCKLYGLLTYTGGTGVVTLVSMLCVERFLDTVCSQSYSVHCVGISSALVWFGWTYSFLMSLAPLLGWNRYVAESSGTACGLDWADAGSSYFIVLPLGTAFMLLVAVACLVLAHSNTDPSGEKQPTSSNWFNAYQLNWIATSHLVSAVLGFGPYGFLNVWTIFNESRQMTMLASIIPPIIAKFSCTFYLLPYLVASRKFRAAITSGAGSGAAETKKGK